MLRIFLVQPLIYLLSLFEFLFFIGLGFLTCYINNSFCLWRNQNSSMISLNIYVISVKRKIFIVSVNILLLRNLPWSPKQKLLTCFCIITFLIIQFIWMFFLIYLIIICYLVSLYSEVTDDEATSFLMTKLLIDSFTTCAEISESFIFFDSVMSMNNCFGKKKYCNSL